MKNVLRILCVGVLALTLTACKTPEEKAQEFYQSGLDLLKAGDPDRAIVEFLNVFKSDELHEGARRAIADTLLEQGDVIGAYRQYSILIEQHPDTPDVRRVLAQIAIDNGEWEEARRHGDAALKLIPDDPIVQSIATTFAYRDAVESEDEPARAAAAATAQAQLKADPYNDLARRIVVDNLLRSDNPNDAMPEITTALTLNQSSYGYNLLRLKLLSQNQDSAAVGKQLQAMVKLFPEDTNLSSSLIGWYLSEGDTKGAETFLRNLAGDDTAATEGHLAVIQLLRVSEGDAAAKVELDRLAAANEGTENGSLYTALSAVIQFQDGDRDGAITTIENIVEASKPSEQTSRIRNILAQLLIADDNLLGARAQIEEILSEDASNVDALKVRATWAIEDDRPDDAVNDLRTALGQEPRDPSILTLMAQAHERGGSLALAGERLAQAVSVSGAAVEESLRYAAFLRREGRNGPAQTVLAEARTANPQNVQVLVALADTMLTESSWVQAQNIANDLKRIDTQEAQDAAAMVQSALLLGQNKVADSISFLESEIAKGSKGAAMRIVQIQLRAGNLVAARSALDEMLATDPDDPTLRTLNANLYAVSGNIVEAEKVFRGLIADYPTTEEPVLRLYNLLLANDRADEAATLIDTALTAQPEAMSLRWIRATALENEGDFEGAIAIYEDMYAADSSQVVVANNLASLLTAHRDDAESLQRAAAVAKRLRELNEPPFQDTYGWIAYRLGNYEEARTYLQLAAAGLANDPLVQFHLGMTYIALGENDLAQTTLSRAIELGETSALPQIEIAREKLAEIGG